MLSLTLGALAADYMTRFRGVRSSGTGGRNPAGVLSGTMASALDNRGAVIIFQFIVGAIVTFGGYAFMTFAVNPVGADIGTAHFALGLLGILAGLIALRTRPVPVRLLLAINGATIAYSFLSEYFVESQSLLPGFAASDSLVGTAVAVFFSVLVIYLIRPEA